MIDIRAGLLRSAAGSVFLWAGTCLAILFLLASALRAQDPGASPPVPPATPAQDPAQPTTPPVLGTVLVEAAKVRCFAGDLSPSFEDTLPKGAVVGAGRTEGAFRQVILPLGPVGYVSKKFTTAPQDGVVKAQGRVSFRYRPKTNEAPTANLADGAELQVIGEHEDWWRVRSASVEAWLPQAELQVFDAPTETMQLAYAELARVQRDEGAAWLRKIAEAEAAAKLAAEQATKLGELQQSLRQIQPDPVTGAVPAAAFESIEQELAALAAALAADSPLRAGVQALQQSITDRKWVAEATAARDATPKPATDVPEVKPEVRDPMERFDAVGWLRYHSQLGRPGYYTIQKGGQVLYHVTCQSQRYDLALFLDKEVGLIGPRRRPGSDSLRVLDIDRVEVLGTGPAR